MSRLVARLSTALVVVATLVAGALYVRALRAVLTAIQGIADRDAMIRGMQRDAADKAKQQAQLDRTHTAIAMKLNTVREMNRRVIDENAAFRGWADTRLPDDVAACMQAPPSPRATIMLNTCQAVSPCTLPALAPRTNDDLNVALTTTKAAWATCAAKVDMIVTCQAKAQPTDEADHPDD